MTRIFRRIRQVLLSENKPVGQAEQTSSSMGQYLKYAVGEVVLVVIGILLALQVNEWNNMRHRKDAEQSIIRQLHADLTQSHGELDEMKDFYLERAVVCSHVLRAFWTNERPADIEEYLGRGISNRIYSPILGTVRSLIASGKIDLISSGEIRNEVIAYVEKVDYILKDIGRYEETYYRKGVELIRETYPNTFKSTEEVNQSLEERADDERWIEITALDLHNIPSKVDKVPFQSDLKDLLQSEVLFLGYSKLHTSHRNVYFRYEDISEITDELLAKLQLLVEHP